MNLRLTPTPSGTVLVTGGPVHVFSFNIEGEDVEVSRSIRLIAMTYADSDPDQGFGFVGLAYLDGLEVADVEYRPGYASLILPGGSRVVVKVLTLPLVERLLFLQFPQLLSSNT